MFQQEKEGSHIIHENAKTLKDILCIRKPDRLAMSEETDTVQ